MICLHCMPSPDERWLNWLKSWYNFVNGNERRRRGRGKNEGGCPAWQFGESGKLSGSAVWLIQWRCNIFEPHNDALICVWEWGCVKQGISGQRKAFSARIYASTCATMGRMADVRRSRGVHISRRSRTSYQPLNQRGRWTWAFWTDRLRGLWRNSSDESSI